MSYRSQHEKCQTIAFLTHFLDNGFSSPIWAGVVDACREYDLNLLCGIGGTLHKHDETQRNIVYDLISPENVAGLILTPGTIGTRVTTPEIQQFCERYRPLPMVSLAIPLEGIPSVQMDNAHMMRNIVRHFLDVHHYRRIAFIRKYEGHVEADERYYAYADMLAQHGIPVDPNLVVPGRYYDFPEEMARILFDERKLRPRHDIEAIVAVDDWTANRVLPLLKARGIRVPQDVALSGFDDEPSSKYQVPPFTTVNQPLYQMGKKAVEVLLAQLRGEDAPLRTMLSSDLVVRRSCGCVNAIVTQAAQRHYATAALPRRETILTAISSAFAQTSEPFPEQTRQAYADELFTAIEMALRSDDQEAASAHFLEILEEQIEPHLQSERSLDIWHYALSVLRASLLRTGLSEARRQTLEDLCQQARAVIGEAQEHSQGYQRLQAENEAFALRMLSGRLITTFDIPQVADILAEHLPRIGIPRCAVSLYENPTDPTRSLLNAILLYHEQGRQALEETPCRYPSTQIVPEGLIPHGQPFQLVIESLYFQQELLGLALFEAGTRNKIVYDALQTEISNALQGALLIRRLQQRNAEITRQKYVLDTFMANVPDSIYFKDRASAFTKVNPALAALLGMKQPEDVIGKSDFDFFSEHQARSKYEQEQAIMRTGQPLLALEEPDASGRWALTTKMPLRDEHGDIIGTFGISRDITPLKQAQQQVEDAYIEIQKLNEQLQQENLRMSAELDIARRLQQMVLPMPHELTQIPGLDIVGYMQPAEEVGGDYYDVLPCQQGRVCIGIGDVTGHGLESGVLMLMTQTAIRTLIDRGETDPVVFLNTLNRVIYQNIQRMGVDRSVTLAMINYQAGQLRLIGQHEEALVVRSDGRVEQMNTVNLGFPLGIVEDIREWVAEATVTLSSGDGVVLYTDGITEAQNAAKKFYGVERLCAVITANWQNSTAEVVKNAIINDVRNFIGAAQIYDDVTLVVLKQQ